ncbi:MAG: adenosylcobinamide-GDP ribazoletransferase [Pyrinomonadaceae bacterium]
MLRRLCIAITFLTRIPLPFKFESNIQDIGRASLFFPLIGAGLGLVATGLVMLSDFLSDFLSGFNVMSKALLISTLIVALWAILTGALHLDGLADMVDGFGGGRTREDVLRIMRDHQIGAFGAVALILLMTVKIASVASLIVNASNYGYLILAPTLGRWTSVPLGKFMPYARRDNIGLGISVTYHTGWFEVVGATLITGVIFFLSGAGGTGAICWLVVVVATIRDAYKCSHRIGGITGDTLGANIEICETLVLVTAAFIAR